MTFVSWLLLACFLSAVAVWSLGELALWLHRKYRAMHTRTIYVARGRAIQWKEAIDRADQGALILNLSRELYPGCPLWWFDYLDQSTPRPSDEEILSQWEIGNAQIIMNAPFLLRSRESILRYAPRVHVIVYDIVCEVYDYEVDGSEPGSDRR